jgi:hypothetical protein
VVKNALNLLWVSVGLLANLQRLDLAIGVAKDGVFSAFQLCFHPWNAGQMGSHLSINHQGHGIITNSVAFQLSKAHDRQGKEKLGIQVTNSFTTTANDILRMSRYF